MHTTRPTSRAGHTSGCTTRPATTSIASDTPIFTISHNMKLTADAPGAMLESLLVMPRAIKAPGTTTLLLWHRKQSFRLSTGCGMRSMPVKSASMP